jgi:hypothetical protein
MAILRRGPDHASRHAILNSCAIRANSFRTAASARSNASTDLNPHEKSAGLIILMLVGVQDIGSMRVKELGNGSDDSAAVGAIDQKNARTASFRKGLPSLHNTTSILR